MIFPLDKLIKFHVLKEESEAYLDGFMGRLGFTLVGQGRHRRTYLSPNQRYVLKIPHCSNGVKANQSEASLYKRFKNNPGNYGVMYAPCRLVQDKILMMWSMQSTFGNTEGCSVGRNTGLIQDAQSDIIPTWAKEVDAYQVGVLRANGKVVAYDFSEN